MTHRVAARPVFVLGPLRSGASLLAWSLAQHSNLMAVADGTAISRLATGLDTLVADVAGPDSEAASIGVLPRSDALWAALGDALNEMILGRRPVAADQVPDREERRTMATRWVDSTTLHALRVSAIRRLFPQAKFLHVARDVDSTVRAIVSPDLGKIDGRRLPPREAEKHWIESTHACLLAEDALGPGVAMRVARAQLLAAPEATMRRCLDFLGEPFEPACMWPLNAVAAAGPDTPQPRPVLLEWRPSSQADALSRQLLEGHSLRRSPSKARQKLEELQRRFVTRELRNGQTSAAVEDERRVDQAPDKPGPNLRTLVESAVPRGATVVVISRGDPALVEVGKRIGWHFPQTPDGTYAGFHPASGDEAVRHLEQLRAKGAAYLAIPADSFWWLDYYTGFARCLQERYRIVAYEESIGLIAALRPEVSAVPGWRFVVQPQSAGRKA